MTRLGGDVIGKEVENVGNTEILSFERLMMEKPDVIFIQSAPERDENILQGYMTIQRFGRYRQF